MRVVDSQSERDVLVQVVGRRRELLDAPAENALPSAVSIIAMREAFADSQIPSLFSR